MKNVTQILSNEHQNILKVIDIMLDECDQIEKGKAVSTEFFRNVLHFIKHYADGYHHAKEETILFKVMLKNMEHMHCNPIPVMLMEHDAGREYVQGMEKALEDGNTEELLESTRGYGYLLQSHIQKEDNILYPMAEQVLDDHQKEEVESAYNLVSKGDFLNEDIHSVIGKLSQNRRM